MSEDSPFSNEALYPMIYPGMSWTSQYVTMQDGVRLAVDVYLPKSVPPGERLPALLMQNRYWRAAMPRWPLRWFIDDLEALLPEYRDFKPFFVRRGFALVNVDVRGTGASFGTLRYPWSPECLRDAVELLDWIVNQPWSNGRVGGIGISYQGTTAEMLLATRHPALRAVVPMYNHPDAFADIGFPGGLFNQRFVYDWTDMDLSLDRNVTPVLMGRIGRLATSGCRPVNGDKEALRLALAGHSLNGNVFRIADHLTYRDEIYPGEDLAPDDLAIHHYRQAIEDSQVPSYGWSSWMDAGTADAALRRFLTYPGADHVTIGSWNHGGTLQSDPFRKNQAPLNPPPKLQWAEIIRFLDAHLKSQGLDGERRINYFTLGANRWQSTSTWPPVGTVNQRWYLASGHSLSLESPIADSGEDSYTVDYQASSGLSNRWWSFGGAINQSVAYPRRVEQNPHVISYLSPHWAEDIELVGSPILHLELACSTPDCAFYAYLEDVAPDGSVSYLTEGLLRALHRKLSSTPPYSVLGPYHTFKQADSVPLIPGEPAEIVIGFLPVSVLLRGGHRLRLSLAGHDEGTFERVMTEEAPCWRILRNAEHASWVELPVKH
jgi:uncharacterized protein